MHGLRHRGPRHPAAALPALPLRRVRGSCRQHGRGAARSARHGVAVAAQLRGREATTTLAGEVPTLRDRLPPGQRAHSGSGKSKDVFEGKIPTEPDG